MAIASETRDDERVRAGIERWLRRSGDPDAVVSPLDRPASGLSSDTVFVNATGTTGSRALVVRLVPAGDGLFPSYDLRTQSSLQCRLHEAGIPTVPARYEPEPEWVGAPFMVMARVPGRTVTTNPPYVRSGWLAEAGADRQRTVASRFLGALAGLHRLDPATVGSAAPPLAAVVAEWCAYLDWAGGDRPPPDYLLRARDWIAGSVPVAPPASVLWGDAQLANCVFGEDDGVAALLDFELAGAGPPELDLGWFLALHQMTVATAGRDLAGFGREEVVATYEQALGRPVADLRWYEAFALLRSGAIMVRIARLLAASGVDDSWLSRGNPTGAALARLLEE